MTRRSEPSLSGIVVNWHDEARLHELVEAWPKRADLELLIVDNGSTAELPAGAVILSQGRNLGFGGGANLGLQAAQAPLVLVMNPDVCPRPGAIEALLSGFERWPDAAALAPRLIGVDGSSQYQWQLRSLPSVERLLLQAMLLPATGESAFEPDSGDVVQQPAAAALCLRRRVLRRLGGFDESFYPAWFEDVDLAKRLADDGDKIRYCPEAVFTHHLGSSIPQLGYSRFLQAYYSNLCRYLEKHHGRSSSRMARFLLVPAAWLRLALLPIRRPRRARSRYEAAQALWKLGWKALFEWQTGASAPPVNGGRSPGGAREK